MDDDTQQSRADRGTLTLFQWVRDGGQDGLKARFLAIVHFLEREPQSDLADEMGVCQSSISEALQEFKAAFGVTMPRLGRRRDKRQRRRWRRVKIIQSGI